LLACSCVKQQASIVSGQHLAVRQLSNKSLLQLWVLSLSSCDKIWWEE
jgi:hypothetical protein